MGATPAFRVGKSSNSPPPRMLSSLPNSNFMDDFYAECDEHLVEIRRALLQLEQQATEIGPDPRVLEAIFRSLHSVKGICGMAGLQSAERLAHAAEDYLRAITRREAETNAAGLDLLTKVTQKIEELAFGHREGRPEQDVSALVERTAALVSAAKPHTTQDAQAEPLQASASPGMPKAADARKSTWRCVFRPSPELSARGVSVNSIRGELQHFGEILRATPHVESGGALWFEFIVSTNQGAALIEKLKELGIAANQVSESLPPESEKSAPQSGTTPGSEYSFIAPSQYVRVEMTRLDDLMRIMGDIVIQQARLEEALNRVAGALPNAENNSLEEVEHRLGRELRQMRDGLMRLRLVPIGEVFDRLPFVVRDLSRENGKKARLELKGQGTELDKYLVERMKDPLLHLVRNAVSHGIEEMPERVAAGKPAEGTITLKAFTVGETVIIEISDDGQGVDREKIEKTARANGLLVPDQQTEADLLDFICAPGFSTRDRADLGAGRGMGMSAVKATVLDLGGELELESEPGCGTTFRLRLPLTLAVADVLIISAGGQRFAMPQAVVQEITTTEPTAINRLEQNEIMHHRNSVLPLLRLTSMFGLSDEHQKTYPVLVVGSGFNAVGIVADRVLGQREIVVRPIKDPLLKVPGISGATELGDGRAVLILDSVSLAQNAKMRQRLARRQAFNSSMPL
jgi:two-component system, chemotaxis family, sensor kinase CheA